MNPGTLTFKPCFVHSYKQKQLFPPPYTVCSSFYAMIKHTVHLVFKYYTYFSVFTLTLWVVVMCGACMKMLVLRKYCFVKVYCFVSACGLVFLSNWLYASLMYSLNRYCQIVFHIFIVTYCYFLKSSWQWLFYQW